MPTAYDDIEDALKACQNWLPTLIGFIGTFNPPIRGLLVFLPLIEEAIKAVEVVKKATGANTPVAIAAVVSQITPGQPGTPVLN